MERRQKTTSYETYGKRRKNIDGKEQEAAYISYNHCWHVTDIIPPEC